MLVESWPHAQATAPAAPLRLISTAGRRTVPTSLMAGEEFIAVDDLAGLLQLVVREDAQAGGLTLTYQGRTAVISLDRPLASVNGRVVALPSPPVRVGGRWLVPIDVLPRAIGPIYDQRLDLRRASRVLVLGDLRVPRVLTRVEQVGGVSRATVDVIPAATVTTLVEGNVVQLRIDADAIDLTPPTGGVLPFGFFDQIRVSAAGAGLTLALSTTAGVARVATSAADNVTRVTIDVPPLGAAATTGTPTPDTAGPPGPTSAATSPGVPPVLSPLDRIDRNLPLTIVLDPGHGGGDVGVRGTNGTLEKAVVLDVARRLRALLEFQFGARVLLTRDDDQAVSLDERAALANNTKADLFVSLHANAAPTASARGIEVLYADMGQGDETFDARAVPPLSLPVVGGRDRVVGFIRWDVAQTPHVARSAALATALGDAFAQHLPLAIREVRQLPLRVLSGVDMPAVLVEIAYLTNPEEEGEVAAEPYQAAVARGIADGLTLFHQLDDASAP